MVKNHYNTHNGEPSYFVFFDVDETVISIKSMFSFLKFYFMQDASTFQLFGWIRYLLTFLRLKLLAKSGAPREFINSEYYKLYRDKEEKIINYHGEKWFSKNVKNKSFFNEKIIGEMRHHKENGANIVFISGSFDACLIPIARYLGADIILATKLEVVSGKYTGKILPPQTIGEGKAEAMQLFLRDINYQNYDKCFAYADHISDLPMLKLVGNPVVVAKCEGLQAYAKNVGWKIIYL